jgi:hypothetical protein
VQREERAEGLEREERIIPLTREARVQEDLLLPLRAQERQARADADAIERRLQTADLAAGPERVAAESDLVNARLRQAEAARQIAEGQAQTINNNRFEINITVPGNVSPDPALMAGIRDAVVGAGLDLLTRAGRESPERVSPEVAGAR